MRFIPVSDAQRDAMLRVVGVPAVDSLFEVIPEGVRLGRPLDLQQPMNEQALRRHLDDVAYHGCPCQLVPFLGAGCYDHYVPAIVDAVISKPEFFTAYTPYQAEVSQGTLQAIYEFQSMICMLTGMDVANASMYDGATALVEAAYLAVHQTGRRRVVVASTIHPEWLETLLTYATAGLIDPVVVPAERGLVDLAALREQVADAAAVLVASPNFFGHIEDLAAVRAIADEAGALMVVAANPILLGLIEPPAAYGADVVVGEGQPLGCPMTFGGPGFGFFACKQQFVRRMPGRIVGRTVDAEGRDAFVLTMQAREQHIRRERATSNICSNHSLLALAASVYLASVGPDGLEQVARVCCANARYLRARLIATGMFDPEFMWDDGDEPAFGYEFVLRYHGDVAEMQGRMLELGYLAGLDLGRIDEEHEGLVLFAVTEQRTREEIDSFVREVAHP